MAKCWAMICAVVLLVAGCPAQAGTGGKALQTWDTKSLSKAPKTYPAAECQPKGAEALYFETDVTTPELRRRAVQESQVRSLFYAGLPYRGRATRVFAFYGVPRGAKGAKFPALVLVHGGGGSAFESWVRLWTARGYAAIAMDVCGCIPEGSYGDWRRHEAGGPPGWGGFDQVNEPVHDQWTYHAVADIILANSLLRSMPEVDPDRIGITGISWGGYLTCIAAGVDSRFQFAVPVYGCGFLGDNSSWVGQFAQMKADDSQAWLKQWDPSAYLAGARMPMLWMTGTNDFHYPMDSLRKSYRLPCGPRTLCVKLRMEHGHGGAGEAPEEIRAFADSICRDELPLVRVGEQGVTNGRTWAVCTGDTPPARAELLFTKDTGEWRDRSWESAPASAHRKRVSAHIPDGVRVCYLNIIDARGLVVSTEHVEFGGTGRDSPQLQR